MWVASTPGSTNGGTPYPGEPFTFPSFGNFGPLYIATLILPGLTIKLPVRLFPTLVILNHPSASATPNTLDVITPPTHQPHVNLYPSSPVRSPSISPTLPREISRVAKLIRRRRNGKRRRRTKRGPSLQLHQMLDPSNQLLLIVLGVLMRSTRLKRRIQNPNSLAVFIRVTTF
jgi:hypothetical protein